MATPKYRVLLPLFPGFNTLDFAGPVEVIGSSSISEKNFFSITVASASEITHAFEGVAVQSDVLFADLLSNDPNQDVKLSEFDIMIIPGGPMPKVQAAMHAGEQGILDVVQAFAELPADGRERWLMSICTGAFFLAARGFFSGKTVTAHWAHLDRLKQLCDESAKKTGGSPTEVVRKRWVDAGKLPSSTRLVTAGGVSCGIDCTLWMVSELAGVEAANAVAMAMDYDWKYSSVPVTSGQIVAATHDATK